MSQAAYGNARNKIYVSLFVGCIYEWAFGKINFQPHGSIAGLGNVLKKFIEH
jgi:hypothetical protein